MWNTWNMWNIKKGLGKYCKKNVKYWHDLGRMFHEILVKFGDISMLFHEIFFESFCEILLYYISWNLLCCIYWNISHIYHIYHICHGFNYNTYLPILYTLFHCTTGSLQMRLQVNLASDSSQSPSHGQQPGCQCHAGLRVTTRHWQWLRVRLVTLTGHLETRPLAYLLGFWANPGITPDISGWLFHPRLSRLSHGLSHSWNT